MQIDDLKQAWATLGTRLDKSLAIHERVQEVAMRRQVRRALMPYIFWRTLEVILGIAVLLVVMPVMTAHLAEPLYVIVTAAVAVFTVGITALSMFLLVHYLKLDYGGPITGIQRDVERIRLVEYRAIKWAVLGGVVVWLPVGLILFEALTGVAALARVDLPWLVANLLFGLIVLAVGMVLSKKHVERPDLAPWAQRLLNAVSGRGLRSAATHLAELSRFEHGE